MQHLFSKRSFFIFVFGLFACSPTAAYFFDQQTFYYGTAVGYERFSFKENYGDGFAPNDSIGFDFFLGTQDRSKIGFEFGFGFTPTRSEYSTLVAGDKFPGTSIPLAPNTWEAWRPGYTSFSIYLGLNKYYYFESVKHLKAFGFLGFATTHVDVETNFIDDDLPVPPSTDDVKLAYNSYEHTRTVPMVKLGLEYDINKYFGLKTYYTWKNTASFKGLKSEQYPETQAEFLMNNTNSIYAGIYFLF